MSKLNVTFTTQAFKDYQFWQQHNLGNFKKLTLYLKVSHEMSLHRGYRETGSAKSQL